MPMPHEDMRRLVKRRIRGTEGTERIKILKQCLEMFPGYYTGPYGELRKWVLEQIEQAKVRKKSRHTDSLSVPKQGDAQIVLLGPPNAGKSSLLKALCDKQVAVGDYPFTTLRPIASTAVINEAHIQLVEIPGLIEGAMLGKGGGRELLSCARNADGMIYVLPLDYGGLDDLLTVMQEAEGLDLELPPLIVCTKIDLPGAEQALEQARQQFAEHNLLTISSVTGEGLCELRSAIWEMSGLMRVYSRVNGQSDEKPFIVPRSCTAEDFARAIHHAVAARMVKARVWGTSAKFPGQLVGRDHMLQDCDQVEVLER